MASFEICGRKVDVKINGLVHEKVKDFAGVSMWNLLDNDYEEWQDIIRNDFEKQCRIIYACCVSPPPWKEFMTEFTGEVISEAQAAWAEAMHDFLPHPLNALASAVFHPQMVVLVKGGRNIKDIVKVNFEIGEELETDTESNSKSSSTVGPVPVA
jgi:hypothetical protein